MNSYSKDLALLFWGTFPTVAILFSAGGCPANGGGVVLPSKGCSVAVEKSVIARLIFFKLARTLRIGAKG